MALIRRYLALVGHYLTLVGYYFVVFGEYVCDILEYVGEFGGNTLVKKTIYGTGLACTCMAA